jgi:uncharacterized protein YcbX
MKRASTACVARLYRYPVKGLTPERVESLVVTDDGRVAGDRVLALRFANSGSADDRWASKHEGAALVNSPSLARLGVRFDPAARRLKLSFDDGRILEVGLDDAGRRAFATAIEEFLRQSLDSPFRDHPERLPLRLVGDGVTPRYQDKAAGQVTLQSHESLETLAGSLGVASLSEERFRSNIVIEGVEAWEEQGWIGAHLRIGEVRFRVVEPKTRCLATHANPVTGERDLPVMQTLVRAFGQAKPTFAVAMLSAGPGGTVRVGDAVQLV